MNAFFAELRRRKVFRVAGVYAVVGWLLVQAAGAFEAGLNLPAWFDTTVIGLLALGFPLALVLAWAFELTPEGVRRAAPVADGLATPPATRTDLVLIAALVALLGVSVFQAARPRAATVAEPALEAAAADALSVAVLPFVNMSSDPEQEYFSDGLSEELLNVLAQIDELRVAGRTSSFAFKGRNEDLRVIAEQLGVANILEGSVRKSGDRLRITAQLVSAADGYHLWSATYDRDLTDVFAVQEEIATAVAEALSVTLGLRETPAPAGGSGDIEAYDLYLRALDVRRRGRTAADYERATELFRGALALDPRFTRAYADLATGYLSWITFEPARRAELLRALERNAAEALAAAPDDPSSQAASAVLHLQRHEWALAEAAFTRADGAAAADFYGIWALLILNVGRTEDAVAMAREGVSIDPLSANSSVLLQQALMIAGRRDEAEAEYQRGRGLTGAIEANEHSALMRIWNDGDAALTRSRFDSYIASQIVPFPLPIQVRDTFEDRQASLALVRAAADDPANQDATRQSFIARYAGHFGDPQLAVAVARRAYVDMGSSFVAAIWFPDMAETRRTPAFKDLVRDLGLVDYWRETGDWGDFCRPLGEDDFECS